MKVLKALLAPFRWLGTMVGALIYDLFRPVFPPRDVSQRSVVEPNAKVTAANAPVVQLPNEVTTVMALVAGVLAGLLKADILNIFTGEVRDTIVIAIAVLGVFVGPLTGAAWRNALHLSASVTFGIQSGVAVLAVLAAQITDATVAAVLLGVLAFAGTLGFGPGTVVAVRR